jgi:hypothetical protein
MNTNRPKITVILSRIFQQLALMLLLTICVTGVLVGCGNNPLQNQQESEERKSGDQENQNDDDDDDDDDKKENSKGKKSNDGDDD